MPVLICRRCDGRLIRIDHRQRTISCACGEWADFDAHNEKFRTEEDDLSRLTTNHNFNKSPQCKNGCQKYAVYQGLCCTCFKTENGVSANTARARDQAAGLTQVRDPDKGLPVTKGTRTRLPRTVVTTMPPNTAIDALVTYLKSINVDQITITIGTDGSHGKRAPYER